MSGPGVVGQRPVVPPGCFHEYSSFTHLPIAHPDLIQATSYFDPAIGEIMSTHQCDLDGMRASQLFLNQFSSNLDGYDAYIRDGLAPWSSKFDDVHTLVDQAIGFSHESDEKDRS